MASSDTSFVLFLICCFTFPPFVFQAVGFFTPMWGSNATCGSIGLVYSCCATCDNVTCKNTNGRDELDASAFDLHAASLVVMFCTVFSLCCGFRIDDDDKNDIGCCSIIGGVLSLLFPLAGLFSFIGCIIVATKFSTSKLGYSFYLCLTAGCLTIMLTMLFCWCMCTENKKVPDFEADRVGKSKPITSTAGGNAIVPSKNTELKGGGEKDDVPSSSSTSTGGGSVVPCEPQQQDITENERDDFEPAAVDVEKMNPFFKFLISANISKRASNTEPPQWLKNKLQMFK